MAASETNPLYSRLSTAAKAGEAVRIIYHGGSQPGAVREISPIHVTTLEVAARDATGIVKTFKLAKIEPAEGAADAPEYDAPHPDTARLPTIIEALDGDRPALESLGWHVVITEDLASLRSFFKNGKPRKTADVSLARNEVWVDEVYDREAGVSRERIRKSILPYRVESRFASGWAFDRCDKATAVFLKEAQALAPASGDAREGILADRKLLQRTPLSWRDDPPTESQLAYAGRLDIEVPESATKGEVSDLIDVKLENEDAEDDLPDVLIVESKPQGSGCLSLVAFACLVAVIVFASPLWW